MSKTADENHWNQTSDYHRLRAPHAAREVVEIYSGFQKHVVDAKGRGAFRVADFACGAGAVAKAFVENCVANGVTISEFLLIDVAQDNLDAAANELKEFESITVKKFLCNGSSFESYSGPKMDFLYCWDAMVHFDILDIASYIRTLPAISNGVALFHHSNYPVVTESITNNPHWRDFNSKDIFRQFCISSGHAVLDQRLKDWGIENLDCITTVQTRDESAFRAS